MSDIEFFNVASFNFNKESAVVLTATSDASPQTVVTVTTPSLDLGTYAFGYAFQVTHSAKNQPLYFKLNGTYTDLSYFANSAGDSDELVLNRFYSYPKEAVSGVVTLNLLMYKPTGGATIDFCDVFVRRVA